MSQNIYQIYQANPITSNASTDLMYFGQSPYGAGDDAAMTYANFAAQFLTPSTGVISAQGTANQVLVNGTSGSAVHGAITLTLPQSIGTSSAVTFGSLTLGTPLTGANGGTGVANTGLTINLGSATTGYVLTSDSSGNATWQAVSASGSVTSLAGDSGSATPSAGVITVTGSTTGLTFTGASHTLSLGGLLTGANGGTGHANTGLTINLGSGASGYLLTSDSSGNATWAAPGYLTGAVLLSPSGNQTITAHRLIIDDGVLILGDPTTGAGEGTTALSMYSPTGSLGSLAIYSINNSGNFNNILQNAATTGSRTWTLPDATGTIALTSGIPSLGDFTFTGDVMSNATSNANITIQPNGSGGVLVGTNTTVTGINYSLQVATSGQAPLMVLGAYKATTGSAQYRFYKSRSTTIGTFATVNSGDNLGQIQFYGDDGTSFHQSATINITAQGTISTGIIPGQFQFQTANSSGTLTTALTISNAQACTFAGLIIPTSTIGIQGTTTNDNAQAGSVGEYMSNSASGVSLTTNDISNITSLSLTAGDWDVWALTGFQAAATTLFMYGYTGFSSSSSGTPSIYSSISYGQTGVAIGAGGADTFLAVAAQRYSLSTTTTVYLNVAATFNTSTCAATGYIYARRVR